MARQPNQLVRKCVIFVSAYVAIMLLDGLMYNIGALFIHVMETFKVSRAEAAIVQTSLVVLTTGTGVINGGIIGRFGIRKSGTTAATMAAVGLSFSFFAPNISFFVFSIGVCGGIGVSIVFICAFNIIRQYFTGRYSSIAMSIVATSTMIGGIVYPHLLLFLSNTFGVRGTFMILGAILCHSVACALCWSLPNTSTDNMTVTNINIQNENNAGGNEAEKMCKENTNCTALNTTDKLFELRNESPTTISEDISTIPKETNLVKQDAIDNKTPSPFQLTNNVINKESPKPIKEQSSNSKCCHKILKPETWIAVKSLMKDKIFVAYVIAAALSLHGIITFVTFVADIYRDKGLSESDTSNALMICNILAVVASPIAGIPFLPTLSVPMISIVAFIIGLSILFLQTH